MGWWGVFLPEESCMMWLFPHMRYHRRSVHREHRWSRLEDNPFWSRRSYLAWGTQRKLWHVQLFGAVPPPSVDGVFELPDGSEEEDVVASKVSFLTLDIFI